MNNSLKGLQHLWMCQLSREFGELRNARLYLFEIARGVRLDEHIADSHSRFGCFKVAPLLESLAARNRLAKQVTNYRLSIFYEIGGPLQRSIASHQVRNS